MDDQLNALMDYTKFHIGLYTTLCTLLIAVMGIPALSTRYYRMIPYFLWALICFALSGVFGGLVGSSLPQFTKWSDFGSARLGPWFFPRIIPAPWVVSAEHTAFWLGTLVSLWGVIKTYMSSGTT
jgi:hypothetical protein